MPLPNMTRAGALAGVLLLTLACGTATPATPAAPGGQTPAPGGQTPAGQPGAGADQQDPCGLATVEEVSAALGLEVTVAEEDTGGDTTYCNYRDASGRSLMATSFSQGELSQTVFNSFAGAEDAVPLPGVGDQAVISGGAVYVLVGQSLVGLQPNVGALEDLDEQQIATVLRQLGELVAGRL